METEGIGAALSCPFLCEKHSTIRGEDSMAKYFLLFACFGYNDYRVQRRFQYIPRESFRKIHRGGEYSSGKNR